MRSQIALNLLPLRDKNIFLNLLYMVKLIFEYQKYT